MKIRASYVSNSSSSSFILCGNNILECLKNSFDSENYLVDEFEKKKISYGDCNKEIYNQCKNYSNELKIKEVLREKIYESCDMYFKYYADVLGVNKCCCYYCYDDGELKESDIYNKKIKGKEYDITDRMKGLIKNYINERKKIDKDLDFIYFTYSLNKDIEEEFNKIVENLFDYLKNKYKEIYVVSFGDNHGECSGVMGGIIEHQYLGMEFINNNKNEFNIHIICVSQH